MNALCAAGSGWLKLPPPSGKMMSRYSGWVASRCTAPAVPWLTPAITRTRTPSGVVYSGTSGLWMSRYQGGHILSLPGRFSQSWKPSITPSFCSGISLWITPRPAVIHCTPPSVIRPSWPALSLWRMLPVSM
jgi:hypothetical protein